MQQLRFNIFNKAHKAIRGLLCDTLVQIQRTDFANRKEAQSCVNHVRLTLDMLYEHATLEDQFILPLLPSEAATVVSFFARQHTKSEMLSAELEKMLKHLESNVTLEQPQQTAHKLMHTFADLLAFNMQHLNMEEQLINPFLWAQYTDEELEETASEAVKRNRPKHDEDFLTLMITHQNNQELCHWFSAIRQNAPWEVFDQFMTRAKNVLPEERMKFLTIGQQCFSMCIS